MSSGPPGLTQEQKAFYQSNGYVLCQGMFTRQEAAALRREAHELAQRLTQFRNIEVVWTTVRQTNTVVQHCHDVQFYSAVFTRLLVDARFTAAAQSILGPNVQLHHTKIFIKPPEKGAPFPMHQDYPYFPHQNDSMIAAIIHFDDAPLEKGCVRVIPGSHKLGPLQAAAADHSLPHDKYPIEKATPCPAEAGDVLFFSYLTIHGSGMNTSGEARTTLLVQMRDPLDPPLSHEHKSRGQGMMLAGVDPSCCTTKVIEESADQSPVANQPR
ncbi:MAG: phytanoyl-CoA dioxygenase family protein [Planctomycetes bacterium]|nr:phytanoyl-CoA dioxygenase family protein [Planctomycetota bacterium]